MKQKIIFDSENKKKTISIILATDSNQFLFDHFKLNLVSRIWP